MVLPMHIPWPSELFKKTQKSYEPFTQNEDNVEGSPCLWEDRMQHGGHTRGRQPRRPARPYLLCLGFFTLLVVFIAAAAIIATTVSNTPPEQSTSVAAPETQKFADISEKRATNCGTNSTTARALGCHFDFMSFLWLRHECFDGALVEEFSQVKPWLWARDPDGMQLVTEQQVRAGEVETGFVQWEYHRIHCAFTWRKLVRDIARGGAMDAYIMNAKHAMHCADAMMMTDLDDKDWNSKWIVHYPTCWV